MASSLFGTTQNKGVNSLAPILQMLNGQNPQQLLMSMLQNNSGTSEYLKRNMNKTLGDILRENGIRL